MLPGRPAQEGRIGGGGGGGGETKRKIMIAGTPKHNDNIHCAARCWVKKRRRERRKSDSGRWMDGCLLDGFAARSLAFAGLRMHNTREEEEEEAKEPSTDVAPLVRGDKKEGREEETACHSSLLPERS